MNTVHATLMNGIKVVFLTQNIIAVIENTKGCYIYTNGRYDEDGGFLVKESYNEILSQIPAS